VSFGWHDDAVPLRTETLIVDATAPDAAMIARAAARLREGGLVAFPTETVYGLGAHALNHAAVARLFEAKGRPANDPLIVHVATFEQIHALVSRVPAEAAALASRFWPGALTLVMPRSALVPPAVTAGLPTVALRVPSHRVARALLEAAGLPIAAPSANLFSRPSPTRASHVRDDLDGRIDMIIDGGPTDVGVESTVLDLSGSVPTVLRPGAIGLEALRGVLPDVQLRGIGRRLDDSTAMPSPGLLVTHYSPRAPLTLYEGDARAVTERMKADAGAAAAAGQRVGILDFSGEADPAVVAARLFAAMRELDASGVDVILARSVATPDGLGLAIQDRLRRAAAGRIVKVY
jgi:L-threonylcarbamoyladenylate synthase